MKSFYELSLYVIKWAEERGIFDDGDPLAQLDKTQEELNETIEAVLLLIFIKKPPFLFL